jgi:hypothetical protein
MAGAWHTWQLIEYLRAKAGIADKSVTLVNKKTKNRVIEVILRLFIVYDFDVMVIY